jgi:hypothetical protein
MEEDKLIHTSAKYSLAAQILTGLIDIIALRVDIPNEKKVLKQLLSLELAVQIVEGLFYTWLVSSFQNVNDVTKYRYYDWSITTSIMLFTLIIYIEYLKDETKTISQIYNENKSTIHSVLILNFMMLLLGYLGEIKKIPTNTSVSIGFIPFVLYYKIIYDKFVKDEKLKGLQDGVKKEIRLLFWYFFIFWGSYGIAGYMPYKQKNISYNVLDLFSKNFFGLFLSYKVYKQRNK